MKIIVAVFLLLSVAEGRRFWRHWGPPPGHSHSYPGETFEPPGQVCPPGHVHTCSPPAQSQIPPGQAPPFSPPGFVPGNQASPNWNQQPQYQQNSNLNSVDVNNAEWVCNNPATGDMMIIVGINVPPSQTGKNPGEVPNTNGNDRHGGPNNGNVNYGEHNDNANTTPQSDATESSLPHGGEGLIDIRLGP